jgi:hypothetical protein
VIRAKEGIEVPVSVHATSHAYFDARQKTFRLYAGSSLYAFCITPELSLEHLYFGKAVCSDFDLRFISESARMTVFSTHEARAPEGYVVKDSFDKAANLTVERLYGDQRKSTPGFPFNLSPTSGKSRQIANNLDELMLSWRSSAAAVAAPLECSVDQHEREREQYRKWRVQSTTFHSPSPDISPSHTKLRTSPHNKLETGSDTETETDTAAGYLYQESFKIPMDSAVQDRGFDSDHDSYSDDDAMNADKAMPRNIQRLSGEAQMRVRKSAARHKVHRDEKKDEHQADQPGRQHSTAHTEKHRRRSVSVGPVPQEVQDRIAGNVNISNTYDSVHYETDEFLNTVAAAKRRSPSASKGKKSAESPKGSVSPPSAKDRGRSKQRAHSSGSDTPEYVANPFVSVDWGEVSLASSTEDEGTAHSQEDRKPSSTDTPTAKKGAEGVEASPWKESYTASSHGDGSPVPSEEGEKDASSGHLSLPREFKAKEILRENLVPSHQQKAPHRHSSIGVSKSRRYYERELGKLGKGSLCMEYSDQGTGDFRSPSFGVTDTFDNSRCVHTCVYLSLSPLFLSIFLCLCLSLAFVLTPPCI